MDLILDTEFDTDCDDVGALAVVHALERAGRVRLRGVACSVPIPNSAGAVRAVNEAYGRADVPIGLVQVPEYLTANAWERYREHRTWLYGDPLGGGYPEAVAAPFEPEEAVALYRRLLSEAEDGSVTVCAIGTLTALAQLLRAEPDLVSRKVGHLVSMALADYPAGRDSFNWLMDPEAASFVLAEWPGPITVSPGGNEVYTGARFMAALEPDHAARRAYETFLGGPDRSRPSWDQLAVLFAALGTEGPFALSGPRSLHYSPRRGLHHWGPPQGPERRLALPLRRDSEMASWVEDWMLRSRS